MAAVEDVLGPHDRAEHLGIQKARASLQVKALEAELGIRLLQRTTRVVRPTPDGEQFLARAALDPFPGSPEQMDELMKKDAARWRSYVELAKIEPQ